jgi:glucose-6-phosphate isomerase
MNISTVTAVGWKALDAHYWNIGAMHLRDLFARDSRRGERMTVDVGGVYLDYSKNRITAETVQLLVRLAEDCGLRDRIDGVFRGDTIDISETRAVRQVALRAPHGTRITVDGENVVPKVQAVLDRMADFADGVRSGRWIGHTGKPIRTIVHIGSGGSDSGPVMAYEALRYYSNRCLTFRFVSNIDGTSFVEAVGDRDPEATLFIVSSKTFTTLETMTNARTAREWSLAGTGGDEAAIAKHFVAVSTNAREVAKFGIDTANMFGLWDWADGRDSIESAVALSTMLAIGPDQFRSMLDGFREMDEHFRTAPFAQNLPVLMGLLGVWNTNFFGAQPVAVLPNEQYLNRFPAYLRQLTMESNGKQFYQPIHHGTQFVPCDFIAFGEPLNPLGRHHDILLATVFAQAEALAFGKTRAEVENEGVPEALVSQRTFPGNRPSNVILLPRLTPATLGKLVSLYEHRVFTQGVVGNLGSFDQRGEEWGKVLAQRIIPELDHKARLSLIHDSSTNALIRRYRNAKEARS